MARLAGIEDAAVTPIAVGSGTVRVGTASWTDPTMTAPGVFYPTGADSAETARTLADALYARTPCRSFRAC